MKPVVSLTVLLLVAVAVAHALRIALGLDLIVGRTSVPMWPSVIGILVPGGLAFLLWREGRQS